MRRLLFLIVSLGAVLTACASNVTAPPTLTLNATPSPAQTSGSITFTVSPSSATAQQLGTASGITPTLNIASGAASTAFTLTATTSKTAPAGTPNLSAFGIGSSAAYVTLSSSNGPAALNSDATITVPASDISGATISAIFIPDGKSGTEAARRPASLRTTASTPTAGTIIAVATSIINGTYTITLPLETYTGTVVFQSSVDIPPAPGCANIVNLGSVCIGLPTTQTVNTYTAEVALTVDVTNQSNAVGLDFGTCVTGATTSVGASSVTSTVSLQNTFGLYCDVFWAITLSNFPPFDVEYSVDLSAPTSSSSPSPSPSPSPTPTPTPTPTTSGSPSAMLALYRATDNITTKTANYPANPGLGPIKAIADEIAADTQAFVYPVGTNLASPTGTITVAPVSSGSAAFCTTSTLILAAYSNSGSATINASTFPYPADGLNIELSDPNAASDVGACFLQFSGGGATAVVPLMINPLAISGNNNGGAFYDSLAAGGTFTFSIQPAAYTAAGLSVPTSLQLVTTDEDYVNPAAGLPTNGGPGAPSCIDAGVNVQLSGSGPYTLTFPPTTNEANAGTECEVYLNDGVTGAPIDFLVNLRS